MPSAPLPAVSRKIALFGLGIFCAVFAAQLCIWLTAGSYTDKPLWYEGAVTIAQGTFPAIEGEGPMHPGTAMLLPIALFLKLPIDPYIAYHIGLSIYLALVVTLIAWACYILRPKSLWWLCAVVLLGPNTIYPKATVPSAGAIVLSVLFVLLLLIARERKADRSILALLGACAGILFATRIDVGAFFLVVTLPYLWYFASRRTFITIGFAVLFFLALDPYLYIDAVQHVQWIHYRINDNRVTHIAFDFSFWAFLLPSFSFLSAFVYAFARPRLTSLPRDFLLWLMLSTEVFAVLMLFAQYHPARYFLPLFSVLEVFLAIFALEYAAQEPSLKSIAKRPEYIILAFFILARLIRAVANYGAEYAQLNIPELLISGVMSILHIF